MKKTLKFVIASSLVLTLSACSSTQTNEATSENTDLATTTTDAETDAVPQAAPEDNVAPALADNAPQTPEAPTETQATPPAEVAHAEPAQPDPMAVQPSAAGDGTMQDYSVQAGDTLMKIAFETYGDLYRWKGILEANRGKITDPNHIPAGTVLKLEKTAESVTVAKNGEKYLIKSGDTLGSISNEVYGTRSKWRALWENNKQLIHNPNRIFAGFHLYYQPDETTQAKPLAEAAPAKAEASRAPASAVATPDPAPAAAPAAVVAPAAEAPAAVPAAPAAGSDGEIVSP